MSALVVGRRRLIALVAAVCLLMGLQPLSVWSEAAQSAGCGPSMQGVDRLKADLGLDNALANRANSLASSALKNGQPPAPKDLQTLTDDSLEGLTDAGDQLDQATGEISKQLDTMNLPRQQRLWTKGVSDMKTARTTLRSALRQDPIARGQNIGSLSPTGVGPKTVYEAATNYQNSVENLGTIADQSGFQEIGQRNWIEQGKPDTPPPPNPGPDPWQEWLKRMQAQAARIQNNVRGLNAAQALRAGQFQQAQQQVAEMQKALQGAQGLANQLGQMAAACNQAANQRQQQGRQSTDPKSGQSSSAPATAAKVASGGGGGGAVVAGVVIAGAAAGGYALYKSMECKEPDMSDSTACGNGSCSACVAMIAKLVPYCDCVEQKHPNEASGVSAACRSSLAQMQAIKAQYRCDPGDSELLYTPIPEPAIIK